MQNKNLCYRTKLQKSFQRDADYSFLDDLGDEWGDFIKLKNNSISLIHAKHDTTHLSATSFHEVVGQALKNLGNFNPSTDRLDGSKQAQWNSNYISASGINTSIPRLRKGDTVANALSAYKKILVSANIETEVILAINFISKNNLEQKLQQLKDGAARVAVVFGASEKVVNKIKAASDSLKTSLIEAIQELHPDHVFKIPAEKSQACASFLNEFLNDKGNIFTTNYDLLLYWVLLRNNLENKGDGFGRDAESFLWSCGYFFLFIENE